MKFVARADGHSVALTMGISDGRLQIIPENVQFSGVVLGRIKNTGISIRGIEFMLLVTTPNEVIVYGDAGVIHWRKPLAGMKAENQFIDAVRFIAADGEQIRFVTGFPPRKKVINHLIEAERISRTPVV
jgi:hypothetical protein